MAIIKNNKGITLVEIMVAIFIISVALISILNIASVSVKILNNIRQTDRANLMAKEAQEAVRSFRDNSVWDIDGLGTLSFGVAYHPELITLNGVSSWDLSLGSENIANFNRSIVIENVSRNPSSHDIDETYIVLNNDTETKKIIVSVSWSNKSVELITYLSNWRQ